MPRPMTCMARTMDATASSAAHLVARPAKDGVREVADDDIERAIVLFQLGSRVIDDELQAWVGERSFVGFKMLLAEIADDLQRRPGKPVIDCD